MKKNKVRNAYEEFAEDMKKTRTARFNAARREHTHGQAGIITVTVLSIFITGVSLSTIVGDLFGRFSISLSQQMLSILASIGIIALSLQQYGSNFQARALVLQRNALDISARVTDLELELIRRRRFHEMENIIQAYEKHLIDAHVNHKNKDYDKVTKKWKDSDKRFLRVFCRIDERIYNVYYWFTELWYHFILGVGVPLAFFFI